MEHVKQNQQLRQREMEHCNFIYASLYQQQFFPGLHMCQHVIYLLMFCMFLFQFRLWRSAPRHGSPPATRLCLRSSASHLHHNSPPHRSSISSVHLPSNNGSLPGSHHLYQYILCPSNRFKSLLIHLILFCFRSPWSV